MSTDEDTLTLVDQDTDVLNGMPAASGDVVIGVGADCTVGYQVRRCFGIDRSFPFDWLITPMSAVIRCIETDFAGFLERDALEYSETGYIHIADRNYGIHYVHHFDRSKDFLDKYDVVKVRLNRRIERWRNALVCGDRVLLVRQSLTDERAEVERLCAALDGTVASGKWQLLMVGAFYDNQRVGRVQFGCVNRHPAGDYRGVDADWDAAFQLTQFRTAG
jgi:hypothetical protein